MQLILSSELWWSHLLFFFPQRIPIFRVFNNLFINFAGQKDDWLGIFDNPAQNLFPRYNPVIDIGSMRNGCPTDQLITRLVFIGRTAHNLNELSTAPEINHRYLLCKMTFCLLLLLLVQKLTVYCWECALFG